MSQQGRGGYRESVSPVIYETPATATYTAADWVALALAALDQAGVTPVQLAEAYRHARNNIDSDIVNAELGLE